LKLIWATLRFLNSLKIAGFVSREIFIFEILGRVHWLDETFSGEIIDSVAQKSRIGHFQSGHLPEHSSVNWAPYETPSPIVDRGLFRAISCGEVSVKCEGLFLFRHTPGGVEK